MAGVPTGRRRGAVGLTPQPARASSGAAVGAGRDGCRRIPRPMSQSDVAALLGSRRNLRDLAMVLLMLDEGQGPSRAHVR